MFSAILTRIWNNLFEMMLILLYVCKYNKNMLDFTKNGPPLQKLFTTIYWFDMFQIKQIWLSWNILKSIYFCSCSLVALSCWNQTPKFFNHPSVSRTAFTISKNEGSINCFDLIPHQPILYSQNLKFCSSTSKYNN